MNFKREIVGFSPKASHTPGVGDTHGWINPSVNFVIQRPVAKPTLKDRLMKRADCLRW